MHQCVCKSVYMHLSVYITVNMTKKVFSFSIYAKAGLYIHILILVYL